MADWNRDDDRDGADDWGARNDEAGDAAGWDDEPPSDGLDPDPGDGPPIGDAGPGAPGSGPSLRGVLAITGVSIGLVVLGFAIGSVGLLAVAAVLAVGFQINLVENLTLQLFFGTVLLQGVGFGSAAIAYLKYRDLGFEYVRARTPTWNDVKWAIAAFVGGYVLLIAGSVAVSALGVDTQGHEIGDMAAVNPDVLLVMIPLSFLLIGPGEELLFRGIIQNAFVDRVGAAGGIAASSAIFALIHLPNYGWLDGLPTIAILFVVSLTWGYVYERTDSLFVPALAHAAFNALQFGLLYVTLKYGPEMSAAALW